MIHTAAGLLYDRGLELSRIIAEQGRKPRIAVINGILHAGWKALAGSAEELSVQQHRRDTCLELHRAGHDIRRESPSLGLVLVLVQCGRQREQHRGWRAAGRRS